MLPSQGLRSPLVQGFSAGSNSIIRKPELIQELPRAVVSGVGEHDVTAHCGEYKEQG